MPVASGHLNLALTHVCVVGRDEMFFVKAGCCHTLMMGESHGKARL